MSVMPRRLVLPLTAAAALAILFAGCAPDPARTGNPTESTGPNPGTSAPAGPTVPPTTDATSTPVTASCDQLVTPDAMYNFNPNFGLLESFTPGPSSAGARATEFDGAACRWQNQTSGEVIDLSVAKFDANTTKTLHSAAAQGTPAPALGDAFFTTEKSVGAVTIFDHGYWIVLESTYFASADDAASLATSVTQALTS